MRKAIPFLLASVMAAAQDPTVFLNVSLVDVAHGTVNSNVTVMLADGNVLPTSRIPPGAQVIDAQGKFLMPGLWDAHIRLSGGEKELKALLAQGVTGVRDIGSPWAEIVRLRDQVGPRIFGSGEPVEGRTAIEARTDFDRLWNADVSFVTFGPAISRDGYIALAEQARHWRLRVAGPIPSSLSALEAIQARQLTIESVGSLKRLEQAFFEQCAMWGTKLVPMLGAWRKASGDPAEASRIISFAKRAKVELLAGTGGNGLSVHDEMEQLVAAGLSIREALEAATLAPARMLSGGVSDWVLLDRNPLLDVRNARSVAGALVQGRYHTRAALADGYVARR